MSRIRPKTLRENSSTISRKDYRFRHVAAGDTLTYTEVFRQRKRLANWEAWVAHLGSRRTPVHPRRLVAGRETPLTWAMPTEFWQSDSHQFVSRVGELGVSPKAVPPVPEELTSWLAEADGQQADAGFALECVALGHALPDLASSVPEGLWWELLDQLLAFAHDAAFASLESDPVAQQLAAGELPLTLRYLFPELKPCHALLTPATASLSEGIEQMLDGEGLPHCSKLPVLRSLLACWTRCGLMMHELKGATLTRDASLQYAWLIRQALRLTRGDGSQAFSNGSVPDRWAELFATALDLAGDAHDWAIADYLLPNGKRKGKAQDASEPEPADRSEWAETALLRSNWTRNGPRLPLTYASGVVSVELECGREVIFSGQWDATIEVAGRNLEMEGGWSENCWFSDQDVDYIELEAELTDGWRLQRHFLLARRDQFLLLADAVLGRDTAPISYRGLLPVSLDFAFRAADETWEGYLVGRRPRALVVPLGLPEWRQGTRNGALRMREEGLELEHRAEAPALFAPLLFDLDPRRLEKSVTWRQLTVAEQLEIQPPHVASAYRFQRGKKQWLIYRSLTPSANRTFLGHNVCSEFLCARFDRDGNVGDLIEIE